MRAVAYVRVSTLKEEQALSLENQAEFFEGYIVNRGDELIQIYSDRGKSATKIKSRHELQKLMNAAKRKEFDKLYVKDISRLFRNTLDFIEFTREIMDKCNILLHLVNMGEGRDLDPFTLNLMAMIAENESKKIQERIKFGKKISMAHGLVPNFVFGYDHIDARTLQINETDAFWVRRIFDLYTEQRWGMARIGTYLYENRVVTKKSKDGEPNYNWSQNTVSAILRNKIYTGVLINGRESTTDIYSGRRVRNPEEDWVIMEHPEYRLISDAQFELAQRLIIENAARAESMINGSKNRRSEKYLFSNLIKCDCCGMSYRRYQKKHSDNGPLYKWWVCSKRAAYGTGRCEGEYIRLNEDELMMQLGYLLNYLLQDREEFFKQVESKCNALIKEYIRSESAVDLDELRHEQQDLLLQRGRIKTMMVKGLLEIEEGKADMIGINRRLAALEFLLNQKDKTQELTRKIKGNLKAFIDNFSAFTLMENMDNTTLKQIVKEIRVISKDEISIYFNVSDDIEGLNFPLKLQDFISAYADTNTEDRT